MLISWKNYTAIILAKAAIEHSVPTFLYISASSGAPMLPSRYISTKRDAERILPTLSEKMRTISLRPAILYDSTRLLSLPVAMASGIISTLNSITGRRIPILNTVGQKPLAVSTVASAAFEAIDEPDVNGILDIADMEKLAEKEWRKGML